MSGLPSSPSAVLFCLVVLVVALAVAVGLRRAGAGVRPLLAILFAYIAIPGHLARTGALDAWDATPPPGLLLIAGLSVLTALIVFSAVGTRIVYGVPLAAIVLLQSFRLVVEWLLHRLYLEGSVPVQMTWSGRNLDVLSGITGLLLGLALLRGVRVPRAVVLGWNILGLTLLANIVAVAVLATPALHLFAGGPPNLLPSTFPWVWLPSFLVQVALGSHLLVFRRLRRE
ncbi:MAG: hypothetical protein ACJ8DJ_03890 [Gemmatimonadales bacterium]